MTPGALVQNVLLGPGVTVSNINYSGTANAIGYFDATGTNLGIATGIVMTTGTIYNNGDGPQGPNNSSGSGVDNGMGGYSQLSNLIGGTQTYNSAILEFDFIPYSDTVRFKYVFGSEEYPEYVGSTFNDVFAFFISGPGISGLQNIAKLPNGAAVAINNVNNGPSNTGPCTNCAYYVYNGDGNNGPYNGSNTYIQYDGFTRVLEAVSRVQCGQTYHLVIAIADAGDGILDSGIFLEANSLTSKVPVSVDYAMSYDAFGDGETMAEGCVTTTVTLTRGANNSAAPLTIPINVSGTATEGVDYTNIPNSVTFAAGQTTVQFTLNAFSDALAEGIETLDMTFDVPDPCGNSNPLEVNLNINDLQPVAVTVESSTVLCPGQPIELIAAASGGVGPYTYIWSTGETTSSIFVSPTSTQTYTVSVTDNCLGETATGSGTVTVPVYQPLTLITSPDIVEICPYVPATITATPNGGAGNFTYVWTDANGVVFDNDYSAEVVPSSSTSYTILVTDQCGESETATINYTITSPPLVLSMSSGATICPFDPVTISVTATGGYGQYYYLWPHSGETTSSVTVAPDVTTNYMVIVSDECQTFTVSGSTTVTVIKPIADFNISSQTLFEDLPITFQNTSQGSVSYQWEFGDGQQSTVVHPNNTYDVPGTYLVTLIATNELGCKDTISKPITILEEYWVYVPNAFTPDGNRFNNVFDASTINVAKLEVWVFNRWGEVVYTSNAVDFSWDGTYKGMNCPDGTYTYKIAYITRSNIEETIYGHVILLR
ncbi:MAG: choice-of-anchor L domain-containing protein [Fluviicola sp.]|nr:choice-of-anchor L domain-containing protein [Fluviicola sp.]